MRNEVIAFAAELIALGFDVQYSVSYACDVFGFNDPQLIVELLP